MNKYNKVLLLGCFVLVGIIIFQVDKSNKTKQYVKEEYHSVAELTIGRTYTAKEHEIIVDENRNPVMTYTLEEGFNKDYTLEKGKYYLYTRQLNKYFVDVTVLIVE